MARPPTEAEEAEFAACATDRRKAPHALRGYAPSFAAARAQDAEYCERVSSLRGRLEGALARRGEGFGSSDPKCGAHAYLRLLLYMHSGVFWLDDSGACVAVPLGAFGAATSTSRHLRDPAALAALRRTLLRSFHRMGAFPMHDAAGVFLVLPPPPLDPGSVTGGSVAGGSVAGDPLGVASCASAADIDCVRGLRNRRPGRRCTPAPPRELPEQALLSLDALLATLPKPNYVPL
jgi:hypothetical protein